MNVHAAAVPVHALGRPSAPLLVAVGLAGLGSAVLLTLGVAAFARRRSLSHLLVALAVATLGVRAGVAGLTMGGVVSDGTHHLAEHALDVATVGLVLGAVYYARRIERRTGDADPTDADARDRRVRTNASRGDDADS